MLTLNSMPPEEFFKVNASNLPHEVQQYFFDLQGKIAELEKEIEILNRNNDLAWEQVSFARDLIEQIDKFSKENLSKAKLKVYNQIRENSYFEV